MTSYQKEDGKGSYTPIGIGENGNGHSDGSSGGKSMKKWIIAGITVVIVGIILIVTLHKPAGASTAAAMEKADLPVSHDGKLMLFDDLSKYHYDNNAFFGNRFAPFCSCDIMKVKDSPYF